MEASGSFPSEIPIFMHGEDGKETEDGCTVIYIKPPPVCGRCVSFGHTRESCTYVGEMNGESETATFAGGSKEVQEDINQAAAGEINGEDVPHGSDEAQKEEVIGTTGNEVEGQQVNKEDEGVIGEQLPTGDDVEKRGARIGAHGYDLTDVEGVASDGRTTDTHVEDINITKSTGPGANGAYKQPDNPGKEIISGNVEVEAGAEELENRGFTVDEQMASNEEDSTGENAESKVDDEASQSQREEGATHATKDGRLGIDRLASTAKDPMGTDSLESPTERRREGGDRCGEGGNKTMNRKAVSGTENQNSTGHGCDNGSAAETIAAYRVRDDLGKKMNSGQANLKGPNRNQIKSTQRANEPKHVGLDQVSLDQHQIPNLTLARHVEKRVVKVFNPRFPNAAKGGKMKATVGSTNDPIRPARPEKFYSFKLARANQSRREANVGRSTGQNPMTTRAAVNRTANRVEDDAKTPGKRVRSPGNSSGGTVRKRKREEDETEEREIEDGARTETEQLEEVDEEGLTRQIEELTPEPNSKLSSKGSRNRHKGTSSPGTHSPKSTGKKLSKNKIKQRARREAGRNATEITVKEIAAKSREDYLIEPGKDREDQPPETQIETVDYSTATGWDEDSDFKDAIEEDEDSDSDYELGDGVWRRSPTEVGRDDDHRTGMLRRPQATPVSTTRGGESGGGEV
ncbi:hypothetical protein ZOSMA_84G00540 [Zostera marina]|uniref:Uncharacterized protein n=1 Tax=Zostera marina TaxID=29655 RepID=A0A0K9NLK8_ZOSMR|nr:hypothetical protein ZOSMA_84G00540 [Zostera marina]